MRFLEIIYLTPSDCLQTLAHKKVPWNVSVTAWQIPRLYQLSSWNSFVWVLGKVSEGSSEREERRVELCVILICLVGGQACPWRSCTHPCSCSPGCWVPFCTYRYLPGIFPVLVFSSLSFLFAFFSFFSFYLFFIWNLLHTKMMKLIYCLWEKKFISQVGIFNEDKFLIT